MFRQEEKNPELAEKLSEEADGILTWIMQGLAMYRAQGLAEPESVLHATSLCRNEMDSVQRFLSENTALDHKCRASIADVREQ